MTWHLLRLFYLLGITLIELIMSLTQLVAQTQKKTKCKITKLLRGSFTLEELETLQQYLPAYLKLKRIHGKKYEGFWEPLWEYFFAKHALKPLTDAQIAAGVDVDKQREQVKKVSEITTVIYH